jgi:hypothetical protein
MKRRISICGASVAGVPVFSKRFPLLIAIAVALLSQPGSLRAQRVCPLSDSGDLLQDKLPVIKAAIPRSAAQTGCDDVEKPCPFIVPTPNEMDAWRTLTTAMVQGDLTAACGVIAVSNFPYSVIQFSDAATGRTYNILQEDIPVTKGWGTYIFNPTASTLLTIEIPHPLFDTLTPEEGIDAFRQLDARTLLMAGTHRFANVAPSTCEPGATSSNADVAHNIENMFEPAHEVIDTLILGTTFVQLHGNQNQTCTNVDVFVSNGTTTPGPLVNGIVTCLPQDSGFSAEGATPTSMCILRGTTNVQGRFSNRPPRPNMPDLCNEDAAAASEKFIHIEQHGIPGNPPDLRTRDPQNRQVLINALRCALLP